MKKSFDSLLTIVLTELCTTLDENVCVLFINNDRNQIKFLFFDSGNISIFAMRLNGSMQMNFDSTEIMDGFSFYKLIENLRIRKSRIHPLLNT